jgi:hypothetical protein
MDPQYNGLIIAIDYGTTFTGKVDFISSVFSTKKLTEVLQQVSHINPQNMTKTMPTSREA